ncbi:MAG: riboflavin biosynthesis protein RibF, partial [candidate division WOR-3 bacterium]
PSTFLDDVVIGKLRALIVVVGEDFRFGSGRKGDVKYMRQYLKTYGVYVEDVPQVSFGDVPVSSTRIRRLIREGKVEVAWQMLGRPYKVIGAVVRGKGRGRIIGFPTANIVPENEVIPKDGVYAVFVDLGDSLYKGVANIGNNPTFGDVERSLEIHLLGFFGDLYGARIGVYFARRLRGEKKFGTIEELKDAIRKDIFAMRSCLEWESLSFGRVL